MADIAYASISTQTSTGATAVTITKPSGSVAGSGLVAIMFADSDSNPDLMAPPDPSPWVLAGGTGFVSTVGYGKVWTYTVGASDPASYIFSVPATNVILFLLRLSDMALFDSVEVLGWGGNGALETTQHEAPGLNPQSDRTFLVTAYAAVQGSGTRSYTAPVGMTERGDVATATWIFGAVNTVANSTAGNTGVKVATCGVAARYISLSLVINGTTSAALTPSGETVTFISPDGGATMLEIEWSAQGRFSPPVIFEEDGVPEMDGLRLRATRHGVKEFVLPVYIADTSEAALRQRMRALVSIMNPKLGDGIIRFGTPAGDHREIVCRYSGGLEMDETLGANSGPLMQRAPVKFRAWSPYYQDVSATTFIYVIGTPKPFFPFFPLVLSSSEVFADTTVTNTGDVDTYPVWEIYGPGGDVIIQNLTTGKQFDLSAVPDLLVGQGIIVDTTVGIKTVTRDDGTNLFSYLTWDSSLFPLVPGPNALRVVMTHSTVDSAVRLNYRQRYLSP